MALSRIRATVTVSAPVASVTVSASGAIGTTAGVTQAAITQVIPIAAIQWVTIVYEAAVDYRGLNPVLREITVVVDASALGVGKGFVESHTAVDQLQPFVINKGIEENPSLTEIVVYEYSKSLADSVDATDDLFGQANLDDEQVMFLVKGAILENVSTADSDNIEFGKNNEEQLSAVDSDPDFDVTKGLDDQLNTSEVLGVDYQKPLTESLDAGDEINGSVQSDDGQTFFMQTNRSDAATVSDQEVQEFGKNTSDSLTTADSLGAFVLGKGITDTPQISEETSYAYTKPVAGDEADASDAQAITFAPAAKAEIVRAQREGPNLIEDYVTLGYFAGQYVGNGGPARVFNKPFVEAKTVSDTVAVQSLFVRAFDDTGSASESHGSLLEKPASDSASTSDATVQTVDKARDDSVSTAEQQSLQVSKQIAETLDATDDVQAEANADDDQVAHFNKTRADHASTSETQDFDTSKALADTGSISEDQAFDTSKPLADTFSTADAESTLVAKPAASSASTADADTIVVGKGLAENQPTSDAATRSLSAARADSVGSSDVLDKLFSRALSDSWTVSDVNSSVFGKALSDTGTLSESKTFDISKAVSDVVDVTDDFDGTATAEDDQTMQFVTSRSEIAHTSDIHVPLVGKGLADQANTGDSGSLRMTDYCDVSYFAESYVGTSLTF